MKPSHDRIPIVMQRSKELPEKFAEGRTKEAIAQGKFFDRETQPFALINVNRLLSAGDGKFISLRFDFAKLKRNPLFSCKANKARFGNPDTLPIPSFFPIDRHSLASVKETKSIGQGVPRVKSKGKHANTAPKRRKRIHAEFQAFHALAVELAYVVRVKDKNPALADQILESAKDFDSWRRTPKMQRVAMTRMAIIRSVIFRNAESRKASPEVKIVGVVGPTNAQRKAKRKANKQAAMKRASRK